MDRLEVMAMLLEVVRHGSFSAAARSMHVSLPKLSRRIAELETHLGARLLTRTTRKIALTDSGRAYVAAARTILDQVRDAEREAAGEFVGPIGELVVTAPTMFGRLHVLPVVADFLDRHPSIRVRLELGNANVGLVNDGVDAAIRIGELPDSAMTMTRLGAIRMVLCASPRLLDERGQPASFDDIARFPQVSVSAPASLSPWRFVEPGGEIRTVLPLPRLAVTTPEAAVDAAVRGVGLVQLPQYQVADDVREGALRIILPELEPPPSPVHLLHASSAPLPLKLRLFLDFVAPRIRNSLTAIR